VTTFDSLEDFRSAVGTDIETSRWIELSQESVDGYADSTGDSQRIHVDLAEAAEGSSGTPPTGS
jgi:acyl dehydratase